MTLLADFVEKNGAAAATKAVTVEVHLRAHQNALDAFRKLAERVAELEKALADKPRVQHVPEGSVDELSERI